jgi:hydrogenase expression/formation protein HypC
MCLAVPGKIVRKIGDEAEVDMQGNRLRVSTVLVPEVREGGWVLVHAGFAIQSVEEEDAKATFELLHELEEANDQ